MEETSSPFVGMHNPPPSPPHEGEIREAEEVFIFMHRNFRVSRNIRAHWFFDHINRTVCIENTATENSAEDEYEREMTVVGIIPKGGSADELVEGERFRVSLQTKVTYISRYYRHAFLLDLSPSTIVADEETSCCLHTKLLECLRLSLASVTRRFTIPGTRRTFCPQVYISVIVFVPFLGFEEDLVLVHGILLTDSNIETVLETVTTKFNSLLKSLYTFSKPILRKWGQLRRRHRNKFDSTCESEDFNDNENKYSYQFNDEDTSEGTQWNDAPLLSDSTNSATRRRLKTARPLDFPKHIWESSYTEPSPDDVSANCDGYIFPEWALIFMLRLGLIAVQTLPENTQSNVIIITDAVAGMPDARALQELLNQIRSYTVSCSFIQLQGRSRSEACFGHVSSCELFHFLAMATFGAYIPNCRCSIGVEMDDSNLPLPKEGEDDTVFRQLNPFHRALICWCFQNALQDNVHITNLVKEINPGFAELYKSDTIRHRAFNRTYVSTLHEILYVRLREGFTLKSVDLLDTNRIKIHLTMPFRPLVFIEYAINAPWPTDKLKRDLIYVDLVVESPYNEIKDLLTQEGGNLTGANPARLKLLRALKSTIESIESADALLMHIHSFNSQPAFYSIPDGASQFAIFHLEDGPSDTPYLEPIIRNPQKGDDFAVFLKFWSVLCGMNEGIWQKWVHMHFERVILRSKDLPSDVFAMPKLSIECNIALEALHRLLKERSSFCLIKDQLYVTFVRRDEKAIPSYFFMVRVSHEPPYLVLKTAFLGGISSTERRKVVDQFRRRLIELRVSVPDHEKPVEALWVIRRPLERILVRYDHLPSDLKTIVRISEEERGLVRDLTMHNAVSKYLECRRRIWPLLFLDSDRRLNASSLEKRNRKCAEFMLTVLLRRRTEEGFKITWFRNGIVGLCRQVYVQSGPSLEQYILFPPSNSRFSLPAERTRKITLPSGRFDPTAAERAGVAKLLLVTELWNEPCAVCDSHVLQSPSPSSDDDVISVLFTMDQLHRLCSSEKPFRDSERQSARQCQSISGCVSVVRDVFDVYSVVEKSHRVLLHVRAFHDEAECDPELESDRMKIVLSSLHRELFHFSDNVFSMDDRQFFAKVMTIMSDTSSDPNSGDDEMDRSAAGAFDCTCRVYVRKQSSWVVSLVIVPDAPAITSTASLPILTDNTLPVLVVLCDESQLAYGMVKRENISTSLHVDPSYQPFLHRDWNEPPTFSIPTDWVSSVRCAKVLHTNYAPFELKFVLKQMCSTVLERTYPAALFSCVSKDIPVNSSAVRLILEEQCDYASLEIETVSTALDTFCRHLQAKTGVRDTSESGNYCCEESNLERLFNEVLGRSFQKVPSLPNYFYFCDTREEPRSRASGLTRVFKFHEKMFENRGVARRDSQLMNNDKKSSGERSPDEDTSLPGSVKHSNNLMSQLVNSRIGKKLQSEQEKATRKNRKEVPLFVYFDCSVEFPDGSVDSFPITFLPSCIHQVLRMCPNQPDQFDVSKVRVKVLLYVLTWIDKEQSRNQKGLTRKYSEDEDYPISKRTDRFLGKLPTRERSAVKKLLSSMTRLLELESVLVDSRKDKVPLHKLHKISKFISKECAQGGEAGRMEERSRPLTFVFPSPEALERLKDRLNGMSIDYCKLRRVDNSNIYYCCQVEDYEAFERVSRRPGSRKESSLSINNSKSSVEIGSLDQLVGQSVHSESAAPTVVDMPSSQAGDNKAAARASRAISHESGMLYKYEVEGFDVNADETMDYHTRKDLLCDFWVILTVADTVTIQFCQRYQAQHARICDLAWRKCRQTIRTINQELLLDSMYDSRVCDDLLISFEGNNLLSEKDNESEDGGDEKLSFSISEPDDFLPIADPRIVNDARTLYATGWFSCELQEQYWFPVHTRLRCADLHDPLKKAVEYLRTCLKQFAVKNIPNTYVVKEENGNVMYMQLHSSIKSLKQTHSGIRKKQLREAEERLKTSVLLCVYGVDLPGDDIEINLRQTLQKRLDQATLDLLISVLTKNNRFRLEPADVEFIQRDVHQPAALFNFSVPSDLAGFLSAVSYYAHQHMQIHMQLARFNDDRSDGLPPRVFEAFPCPGQVPDEFQPNFYLYVQPPQGGRRTTGIACLEIRLVTPGGQLSPVTDGVLRGQSHSLLVKNMPDKKSRALAYRELTHTVVERRPREMKGVCAFVQVIVWQAGDVGIKQLEDVLSSVVEQAHCDVVTEYGVLNLSVLETTANVLPTSSSHQLPHSPLPITSPQNKASSQQPAVPKSSPLPPDRRQPRKRDSSEVVPPTGGDAPATPNPNTDTKKATSVFSFGDRRGSIASEIGSLHDATNISSRLPSHVNSKFVASAADWFDFVAERGGEGAHSVRKQQWTFDCQHTGRRALSEMCDQLEDMLRSEFPNLSDTVSLCENVGGRSGTVRYEVTPARKVISFVGDFGMNPEVCEAPQLLLIAMSHDVAKETLRFGYEKTVSQPPDTLVQLEEANEAKHLFLPNLDPFIPRQRILYGMVHGETMTLYFYNFLPFLATKLRNTINRTTLWHNSRARLLREIGLHKLGITHLSPLELSPIILFQSADDNPYLCLVWRNPDELLDKEYPPESPRMTSIGGLPKGYANRLFRPYRGADLAFLHINRSPCLILNQMEQMRALRNELRAHLNSLRTYNAIHSQLLKGKDRIGESDLNSLLSASRRVHFVQTPVLLFPKWRRKIAEMRGSVLTAPAEGRKSSTPTGSQPSSSHQLQSQQGVMHRPRANTLSVPTMSRQPAPFRFKSEDDDPCQVKILYMLMNDYLAYLGRLGMKWVHVTDMLPKSKERSMYRTDYPQGCGFPPTACLYKVTRGGIILLHLSFAQPYFILSMSVWNVTDMLRRRDEKAESEWRDVLSELEETKDELLTRCHMHSFTYDFHLRMLSKYLVGKDEVLFNPGYNTYSFLVDFLKYYGCRPPNARNCVYEERPTFELQHEVQGSQIWTHFLEIHYEKFYDWKVVKLKNTEDDSQNVGERQRNHDFMLVSSDMAERQGQPNCGSHEKLRVLLRDRRRQEKKGELMLVQYLILIDTNQSGPVDEERQRESSRQSDSTGEFRNVERPSEADKEAEIEDMLSYVSLGGLPNVDGSVSSPRRRRFSSGGHAASNAVKINSGGAGGASSDAEVLSSSSNQRTATDLKSADSDGDVRLSTQVSSSRRHRRKAGGDDGEIPCESVIYVQFLSIRQQKLQKLLEDAVMEYSLNLKKAVRDAEWQCRRDHIWDKVLQIPAATSNKRSQTVSRPVSDGGWSKLRAVSHDTKWNDLDTLISLVRPLPMQEREPRLEALLQGTNCSRLCRFLFTRYGAARCRFFEYPDSVKKCLLITNPNDLDSLFLVKCEHEKSPSLLLLFKDEDNLTPDAGDSKLFRQKGLDTAFDELVQCVTASLWSDLLQNPPGRT